MSTINDMDTKQKNSGLIQCPEIFTIVILLQEVKTSREVLFIQLNGIKSSQITYYMLRFTLLIKFVMKMGEKLALMPLNSVNPLIHTVRFKNGNIKIES